MPSTATLARTPGRLEHARRALRDNPALLPAILAVAVLIALAGSEAGFYPIGSRQHQGLGWYPGAVIFLALLAVGVAASRPRRPSRPVLVALTLFAAYTVWTFLSISWAEQQAVAWDGANRTAVYLIVFALFSLWPLTAGGATVVLGALGLGLAGLGLLEILRADAAPDPILFFVDARFAEPAGYINANVAVWTLGLFLCLHLSCSRDTNALVRGLGLGGAGILACLALLGQSRGWVFAAPLGALAFVALTPYRARALVALGVTALGTFAVSGSLLAVHDEFTPEALDALLAGATRNILVVSAILAVAGVLAAVADSRMALTEQRSRTINRSAVLALVAVLGAAAVVAVVKVGDPIDKVSDSWESFKQGGPSSEAGASRFTNVGTNRYDFWRVALDRFKDRPLTGIGSENFQQDYLARSDSAEQPRYPHSLGLGVLSQTGLVGALLFTGTILAALAAVLTGMRRGGRRAAAVTGAGATVFFYWLFHASIDWFWEFPALTGIAFAMLGMACAVGGAHSAADEGLDRAPRLPRAVGLASSGVAGTLLLVSFVLPWMSEREVERAATEWRSSPGAAFDRLDRAGALNPISPKSNLVAGTIAVRVEDQARAVAEFEKVLELEPRTPFALAELAALASERGQDALAEQLLDRASGYAPNDGVVTAALKEVRSGSSIDVQKLNADYLRVARYRLGRE